jgi:hypothetical protein
MYRGFLRAVKPDARTGFDAGRSRSRLLPYFPLTLQLGEKKMNDKMQNQNNKLLSPQSNRLCLQFQENTDTSRLTQFQVTHFQI